MKHAPDLLKQAGLKTTPARREILNVFLTSAAPLSVEDIRDTLAKQAHPTDKVTTYRTIKSLCEAELIRRVDFGDDRARYERSDLPHHHHLICESCGKVEDTPICLEPQQLHAVTQTSRFHINHHALDFYGTCANCAQ